MNKPDFDVSFADARVLNEARRGHAECSMVPCRRPRILLGRGRCELNALFSFFMKQVLIDKSIKSKIVTWSWQDMYSARYWRLKSNKIDGFKLNSWENVNQLIMPLVQTGFSRIHCWLRKWAFLYAWAISGLVCLRISPSQITEFEIQKLELHICKANNAMHHEYDICL